MHVQFLGMSSHTFQMRNYRDFHCWVVDKKGCRRDGSMTPRELESSQGDSVKLVCKAWSEIPKLPLDRLMWRIHGLRLCRFCYPVS